MRILFLCTGNSCRSQMAEGWARELKSGQIEALSAGVAPHGIDPRAVKVMAEAGVDISAQTSKHVATLADTDFAYVITLCDNARESCPFFPARVKILHVPFDDPQHTAPEGDSEEERLAVYRRVRDEIRSFVDRLPEALFEKQT